MMEAVCVTTVRKVHGEGGRRGDTKNFHPSAPPTKEWIPMAVVKFTSTNPIGGPPIPNYINPPNITTYTTPYYNANTVEFTGAQCAYCIVLNRRERDNPTGKVRLILPAVTQVDGTLVCAGHVDDRRLHLIEEDPI